MFFLLVYVATAATTLPQQRRRFALLSQPRSGTTWLVKFSEEFARVDGVVSAGELMHPRELARRRVNITKKTYMPFVERLFDELLRVNNNNGSSTTKAVNNNNDNNNDDVVGFKIMYQQLPPTPRESEDAVVPGATTLLGRVTLEPLLSRTDILYVHLVRLNHLERFVSVSAIVTYNLPYHVDGGTPTAYSLTRDTPVLVSPEEAFSFAVAQAKQNDDVERYLRRHCAPDCCLTLVYEDLLGGPRSDDIFADLRRRLGLTAPPPKIKAPSRRPPENASVPCSERVLNWAALENDPLLGRTIWVAMCLNGNRVIPDADRYGIYSIFANETVLDHLKTNHKKNSSRHRTPPSRTGGLLQQQQHQRRPKKSSAAAAAVPKKKQQHIDDEDAASSLGLEWDDSSKKSEAYDRFKAQLEYRRQTQQRSSSHHRTAKLERRRALLSSPDDSSLMSRK